MKAVILAGGLGTRISEETAVKPKPMVEIGDMPILWHIMKIYSAHGIHDFVICCGYKGHIIKEFFANFVLRTSSLRVNLRDNSIEYLGDASEPWSITLADTGESTMTGGRIKRIREFLDDEPFCLTYGDGVSDVDITKLVEFHEREQSLVTLTAVQPPGRFGAISLASGQTRIHQFHEKPDGDGAWVNGGYFVVDPAALDYIGGDGTTWEQEPLRDIAQEGKLSAFRHQGFWHPMDTLRDKNLLDEYWAEGKAPWKKW
ncbi:MAG: glucose-1-phosphate cytidylyltransferase [Gammaproteobacteria bacterium]|nr:glucose-1-phosphate cytidylyltransferase [Gammaproteobacteria bacterium]